MADELTLKVTFNYNPSAAGEVSVNPAEFSGTFDVSANAEITTGTQVFTAASEATLNLGDVTDPGFIMLKNVSTANFVEFNAEATPGAAKYTGKLKAGEFCVLRIGDAATEFNFLADTTNQTVQYWLIAD